jgi:hypothetical protein
MTVGGATIPPLLASVDTTKAFADPAALALLGLFSAAITGGLALTWDAVAAQTSLQGRLAVNDTYPEEPDDALLSQRVSRCPALYLHRAEGEVEAASTVEDQLRQQWLLTYVLGQLDAAEAHKFSALMLYIPSLVSAVARVGGHPDYGTGVPVIGDDQASGIAALRTGKYRKAKIGSPDGSGLHAIVMQLETVEIITDLGVSPAVPAVGTLTTFDLQAGTDGEVQAYLETDTEDI